jgi:hypothetical protein
VKSVLHPDTKALLGNNYSLQIIETGFAEQFYASHRMQPAPIFFENFRENSLKRDLSNDTTANPPLFSLVNTLIRFVIVGVIYDFFVKIQSLNFVVSLSTYFLRRNFAFVWKGKDDIKYKTEEDIKRLDAAANREPNQGILDHERKRKLEVGISGLRRYEIYISSVIYSGSGVSLELSLNKLKKNSDLQKAFFSRRHAFSRLS